MQTVFLCILNFAVLLGLLLVGYAALLFLERLDKMFDKNRIIVIIAGILMLLAIGSAYRGLQWPADLREESMQHEEELEQAYRNGYEDGMSDAKYA